ncbi:MAG: PrsW family intramembrane metalloprotease [Deinococcus sp.]|nr:PrsW family intramembrane metalloprotease [Deinococcus sp.]
MPPLGWWGLAAVLASLPAALWLWFYLRHDTDPEPRHLIWITFLLGMAAVVPPFLAEQALLRLSMFQGDRLGTIALRALVVIGPLEEIFKLLAALPMFYHPDFDEAIDGLVYATSASLGFATIENLWRFAERGANLFSVEGLQLFILRGVLSTLGHVLFAASWGYALGQSRLWGRLSWRLLGGGLALASLAHGLFDLFLMADEASDQRWQPLVWLLAPLMITLYQRMNRYLIRARFQDRALI